jgi:hypothetical protein
MRPQSSRKALLPPAWLLVACGLLAEPSSARACATCACGDPTLTVMGAQQPYANRFRPSLEFQYRTDAVGEAGVDRVELREQRLTLGVAYAPLEWLMLSATLPLLWRTVTDVSLAETSLFSPGDLELRSRIYFWRDREFAPRHLLAAVAGLQLPTAPLDQEASGEYLEPELQGGTGAFQPVLGASYSFFADPWSVYASELAYIPFHSRADWHNGAAWRGSHVVQYQFVDWFAARFGANFRWEMRTRRDQPPDPEPDTGGFVLFLMPSVVLSPVTDLVINIDLQLPVVNALFGDHDEGPLFAVAVAYDF